jgi:hypothetical protein
MTEAIGGFPGENLELKGQYPMVIPEALRNLELAHQLPSGDISYFDVAEPDNFRLVNRETWQGILKKGIERRIRKEEAFKHRFAAIILHTPARTSDAPYEKEIKELSRFIRRTSEKENGITVEQNLGMLFVVEEKGKDQNVGWRQAQLTRSGLVVEKTHGGSVVVTDLHVISFGRRQKQRPVVDLTRGRISKNIVEPFLAKVEKDADIQGLTADTSKLRESLQATNNIPRALSDLKDANRVTFTDRGGETLERSENKGDVPITQRGREIGKDEKSRTKQHMSGDKVVSDRMCGDCGEHLVDLYYQRRGKVRYLLFRKTVCEGTQHKDSDTQIGPEQYIRPLERIPRNQE